MGTVGINFGSATSGAGFDVTTTVASIVANLKAVETPWTTQLSTLTAQSTAFTSIGTDLGTLSTSLQSLTDFQGVLASKQGSSSDTDVLSLASAGPTATAGSHTIVVSRLAQTSSASTSAVPTGDILSGGLTLQVGSGTAQSIPVVSGTSDTLASYAAAINLAGVGVTASIVTDTTGSRLSLISQTSGASGQLTITGALTDSTTSAPLTINPGLTGQDAQLTVDNIPIDSASNTISTAIPGVTFQLLAAAPSTQIQVQVANDNSTVETAVSTLVSSFNKVLADIKTQEGKDSSGNAEPLFGNTLISQLQSSLSLALTAGSASGSITSIDQLGITLNNDGTLALDTSTLDASLNSNYQDVVGFFQNSNSFGQTLQNTLDQLGNQSPTGAITLALSANSTQQTTLNDDVTQENTIIATEQANLTTELNLANEALQSIPSQLNEVNELYNALTGYTQSTA